jgi:hypothetical protein
MRVRRKAINVMCDTIENILANVENYPFFISNGLDIITKLIIAIISKKDDGMRVNSRIVDFLQNILFEKSIVFDIVTQAKGKKRKQKTKKADNYDILVHIYSQAMFVEDNRMLDGIIQNLVKKKVVVADNCDSKAINNYFIGDDDQSQNITKSKALVLKDKNSIKNAKYIHDKDIIKIIKSAVTDFLSTYQSVYLNIINSFIKADITLSEEVYEVFTVLYNSVSYLP